MSDEFQSEPGATPSTAQPAAQDASQGAAEDAAYDAARTHFGFRDVTVDEKPALVRGVFSNVAARYDLMNDLMSARVHRLWKEALLDWLAPRPGERLLDLAGGTGDIAFRYLRRVGGIGDVVVCDLTPEMLEEGRRRAEADGVPGGLTWVAGDATALPFQDGAFDKVTMAFGIRNVAEPDKALREIRRVLRFGGRAIILEFSRVRPALLRQLYDAYSFNVIPRIGQVVVNDRDSYQYLVESIRKFPNQERFAEMLREAGFERVAHRDLTLGVAAMHSGWKL